MKLITQQSSRRAALSAAAGILLVLALSAGCLLPVTALGAETPNISGTWDWTGRTIILGPGSPEILWFFGVKSEGPVLYLICNAWGTLTISQTGSSFTGTTDQASECTTRGGQHTTQTPFPNSFGLAGSIHGHAVSIDADGGDGIPCSYSGSISVQNGVVTQFHTTGGCDVPLPFHPAMTKDINFDGVRQ